MSHHEDLVDRLLVEAGRMRASGRADSARACLLIEAAGRIAQLEALLDAARKRRAAGSPEATVDVE